MQKKEERLGKGWLVDEGAEILKHIAERMKPCREYALRNAFSGSSRTVWRQLKALQKEDLVRKTEDGYELTDLGYCALISRTSGPSAEKLLTIALRKFPNGITENTFREPHREIPLLERKNVLTELKKRLELPNVVVMLRTDENKRVVSINTVYDIMNEKKEKRKEKKKTGRINLRVMRKVGKHWKVFKLH